MPSRMDRYYKAESKRRSTRNSDIYRDLYSNNEYSNIEGVASIEKTNEIDITRIQEMLKNRENYRKEKKFNQAMNIDEEPIIEHEDYNSQDDRTYDIMDVLSKAKDESKEDMKYHSIQGFEPDALKRMEIKDRLSTAKDDDISFDEVNDNSLSLDLLSDLKSDGNTTNFDISAEIKRAKDENAEMDDTFFTSAYGFKSSDFDDLKSINNEVKKNSKLIKVLIVIVIITILVILSILGYKYFMK